MAAPQQDPVPPPQPPAQPAAGIGQLAGGPLASNRPWFKHLTATVHIATHNQATVFSARLSGPNLVTSGRFAVRKEFLEQGRRPTWGDVPKEEALVERLKLWRMVSAHPNINAVLAWGVGREYPLAPLALYTAMPLVVDGRTLHELSEEWEPVEFPGDDVGGLRMDADRAQLKMWIMKASDAVQYCHDQGVHHGSLHPRNMILQPNPQRPFEKDVLLCDFGRSESLTRLDALDANAMRADDIRCLAHLYVFGKWGYYEYVKGRTDLPPEVEEVVYADAHEKGFIKGVLNATNGELQARHVLCYPLFNEWEKDLPNGHRYKPTKGGEKLEDKFFPKKAKGGEAPKLKIRPGMRNTLAGMDANHGNAPCRLVFPLAPLMVACEAAGHGQGNNGSRCPQGTLYDQRTFMKHAHPVDTDVAHPLVMNGNPAEMAAYNLVKNATYRGNRSMIISKEVLKCSCGKWADVEALLDPSSGAHQFRLRCHGCNKRSEAGDFYHLAEVVELRVKRSDRKVSWISLVDECSERLPMDKTEIAKLFKQHLQYTWVDPTQAEFKNQGNAT